MSLVQGLARAAVSTPIVSMVAKVYVPTLFPLTFLIALVSLKLDQFLDPYIGSADGWLPTPLNYYLAGGLFVFAVLVWLWTYQQLTVLGEGSPSPTAGRTLKLVRTGIYAYSRNPSLYGKTLGVFAVGMAINSFSFCFVIIPMLLAVSLWEKVTYQEPQLIEIFGEDYIRYRDEVDLFIPFKVLFRGRKRG